MKYGSCSKSSVHRVVDRGVVGGIRRRSSHKEPGSKREVKRRRRNVRD